MAELYDYSNPALPNHFVAGNVQNLDTLPNGSVISDAGPFLSRVLFYDKQLSFKSSISCTPCHEQSRGFSDDARLSVGFSVGFEGRTTARHSMGLTNARYYNPNRFFWGERASSLGAQTLQPIQDSVEMGESLTNVIAKLQASFYYLELFLNALEAAILTPKLSLELANSVSVFWCLTSQRAELE